MAIRIIVYNLKIKVVGLHNLSVIILAALSLKLGYFFYIDISILYT